MDTFYLKTVSNQLYFVPFFFVFYFFLQIHALEWLFSFVSTDA